MAGPSTVSPISRALIIALRANTSLKDALTGMHEGIAPSKAGYPFLTYHLQYAPMTPDWGAVMRRTGYTIQVWSTDQVEARNLDSLVAETLWDAALSIDEQTTLLCRRVTDLSSVGVDDQGYRVYQVGGVYEIWTDREL